MKLTKDDAARVLTYVLARPDLYASLLWLANNDFEERDVPEWTRIMITPDSDGAPTAATAPTALPLRQRLVP